MNIKWNKWNKFVEDKFFAEIRKDLNRFGMKEFASQMDKQLANLYDVRDFKKFINLLLDGLINMSTAVDASYGNQLDKIKRNVSQWTKIDQYELSDLVVASGSKKSRKAISRFSTIYAIQTELNDSIVLAEQRQETEFWITVLETGIHHLEVIVKECESCHEDVVDYLELLDKRIERAANRHWSLKDLNRAITDLRNIDKDYKKAVQSGDTGVLYDVAWSMADILSRIIQVSEEERKRMEKSLSFHRGQ